MNNSTKQTMVTVQCLNNTCGMRKHVLGAVDPEDTSRDSTSNPKNLQYCPACRCHTVFQCPECYEWHELRFLSVKPYVCSTAVNTAVKKYNSVLFDPTEWMVAPLSTWVLFAILAILAVSFCDDSVSNNVVFVGYSMDVPLFEIWSFAILVLFPWLTAILLSGSINKKRKTQFSKEFPEEWGLVQRFPNGLS